MIDSLPLPAQYLMLKLKKMGKTMKKILLLLLNCLIVFSFFPTAYAAGQYVSGNIGLAILTDSDLTDSTAPGVTVELESDNGMAFGIAFGYSSIYSTRTELELVYQTNDIDQVSMLGEGVTAGGDTSTLAFLLNGYYDFVNNSKLTPFISAGIGFAKVEVNDFSVFGNPIGSDDDMVLAYQVGAGVGYAVTEKVTIDLKYRYFGTSNPEFDTTEAEYSSHNFYFGIRVSFF